MNRKRILLAMSGGVDSTISVLILKEQGFDVHGIHFLLWHEKDKNKNSNQMKELSKELNIPIEIIDAKEVFYQEIVQEFLNEYKKGNTPNPCVFCNKVLKFSELFKYAKKINADFVATGHYAISKDEKLFRGKDSQKDQSYFLQRLKKENLKKIIFPLGNLTKKEVKKIAKNKGLDKLINQDESQDLCFLESSVQDFLKENLDNKYFNKGNFIHKKTNEILDQHNGVLNFTIGQRARISGQQNPLFVHSIDFEKNIVFVSDESDLYSKEMKLKNCSWISDIPPKNNSQVLLQIRHRAKPIEAKITTHKDITKIQFANPVRAITPGQHAAIYNDNEVLGGGVIG